MHQQVLVAIFFWMSCPEYCHHHQLVALQNQMNVKFFAQSVISTSYIQEHADICLESRQKDVYIVSGASDTDDNEEKTDLANSSINHEDIGYSTRDDLKSKLLYIVSTKCSINDNEHLQLNIRRGHCFEDFRRYFSKKWNAKRKNDKYIISFLGEAGVDTGGVSREFYSG